MTTAIDEIERGLTDKSYMTRRAFAERKDFTPTPEQVARGLADDEAWVRSAFANRTDIVLTPDQVEQGLWDEDEVIQDFFVENHDAMMARYEKHLLTIKHKDAIEASKPTPWEDAM